MRQHLCLVVEQGLSLAIGRLWVCNATEETVTSVVLGAGDIERRHGEETKNNKRKDPLQSNDLDGELSQRES